MRRVPVYYTVYIDVLFIVNFLMDFVILWFMNRFLNYSTSLNRLLLGALLGAVWICFLVGWPILPKPVEWILTYIGISSGMVFLAFRKKTPRELVRGVIYLYVFSLFLGGVCNYIYYHTRVGSLNKWFLMTIIGIIITYMVFLELYKRRKNIQNMYEVELFYQGRSVRLKGLSDSGNELYDTLSGKAVSVVEYGACKDLIITVEKLRYIPFRSVGKSDGVLVVIEIDRMLIETEKQGPEKEGGHKAIEIRKPMIGICKHALCQDRRYHILLHPTLTDNES